MKMRVKDPRVTLQAQGQAIQQIAPAVDAAWQAINELRMAAQQQFIGLQNMYARARIAAIYPWPISLVMWLLEERKAKQAFEKEQMRLAIARAKAQAEMEAKEDKPEEVELVLPAKVVLGPDGAAVSVKPPDMRGVE